MKTKNVLIMIIIMIIMCIPTPIFAWLHNSTYEVCNIANVIISVIMRIAAFIIGISYITISIKYLRHSNSEKNQKLKNILIWLIIVILEVLCLVVGSLWVTEIGMEKYWTNGERFQFNEIDGTISMGIRIGALISMIIYAIWAIIYYKKSKSEQIKKILNIVKWQVITSAIVGGLLILATNW